MKFIFALILSLLIKYSIEEETVQVSNETDELPPVLLPPTTTDIELQQQIDNIDGDDCPGVGGCLACCPLGYARGPDGCFTCQCRRSGIFADDMIITEDIYDEFFSEYIKTEQELNGGRAKRAANKQGFKTWTKPRGSTNVRIPYMIDFLVSDEVRKMLNKVFATLQKYTCVRFVYRSRDLDYIKFNDAGDYFCASHVGKIGGIQKLYLGRGCWMRGVIAHEVMHALGFDHEQSRPDRDQHVRVLWRNVKPGKGSNFSKKDASHWDSYGTPYDTDSVMHYESYQSSRNGEVTMLTKAGEVIARNYDFSMNDLIQINRMYGCSKHYENVVRLDKDKNFCRDEARNCKTQKQQGRCESAAWKEKMLEQCRETCNYCEAHHFTTPVTQTPVATQAPTKNCRDNLSICPSWAKYNYCNDARYKLYTRMKCKWSCGLCDKTTTTTTTRPTTTTTKSTTTLGKCVDSKKNCKALSQRGYCTNQKYQGIMTEYCRKTCNFCDKAVQTSVKTSVTQTTTPEPTTTPKVTQKCTDASPNCWSWSKKNFCNHLKYRQYMRRSCTRSCGLCPSQTTEKITTTTTTPRTTTTKRAPVRTTTTLATTTTTKYTASVRPNTTPRIHDIKRDESPRSTTPRSLNLCVDKIEPCEQYKQRRYCKRISSQRYMYVNCRKTCGMCRS